MLRYFVDYFNLLFFFGVILEREFYVFVIQFYGIEGESLIFYKVVRKNVLCKKSTVIVFKNIVKIVEYIYIKGVIYNDLKANNVLI